MALLAAAIVAALLYSTLRQGRPGWGTTLWLGLILGGAAGNLIDRIRLGAVVDFLDFRVWPVFNVADACITIGAVGIAWGLLRRR